MTDPRHSVGRRAEAAVAAWLEGAGWRVLARRWRCAYGELDLICLDPAGTLVAVEVRARRTSRTGAPEETVDARRLGRLERSLAEFATHIGPGHAERRVDLVALSPARGDVARRWHARRIAGIGE